MLPGVTVDLPPPSGAPQPAPAPPATPASEPFAPHDAFAPPPVPPPPYAVQPGHPSHPDHPAQPGLPHAPTGPRPRNGLAIAALCCGIAALVPVVGVVAVVLGVVALNQLRSGLQRGRGMAIAGIVLGVLGTLAWAALLVLSIATSATDEPPRAASGQVTGQSQVFVDKLKAGDCFSGGRKDQIDLVTAIPCSKPHESQVVTVIELADGPYPGDAEVTSQAEKGCTDKADPLLTDQAYDDLEPSYIYPDADTWRGDRSVLCLVESSSGTTTGSALK
jgi:hypothetical protein